MVNILLEVSKDEIFDLINQNIRIDERSFEDYRDIKIKQGHIDKAEGSAVVSIGNTTVVAGVKAQLTTPFNNSPDEGILIVNTELLSIANRNFESGPPNKYAVEISRVVDRTIRESPLIDLKKLCIVEGKNVWKLHVDVYVIDYDGNSLDTVALASICALINTKIPDVHVEDEELVIDEENMVSLPIENLCSLCSISKINGKLLVDPNLAEEVLTEANISIGFRVDGSICCIQKGGFNPLTIEEIRDAMNIAQKKSLELISIIEDN